MLLIFLDTETTGLNPKKHRAIEIAYKIFDCVTQKVVLSYESVISQSPDVWAEADSKSLEVNGFTWEVVISGKSEKVVASEIMNDLNRLKLGERSGVFVCQNPSFDRAFFTQLIDTEIQEHCGWPYHWLDLASMYWAVLNLQNPEQCRHLEEMELSKNRIAEHYGLPPEAHPHRAVNGVNHLMSCYEALFSKIKQH